MSTNGFNSSRRNILKGLTYASILSLGGLSSLAFAVKRDIKRTLAEQGAHLSHGIRVIQALEGDTVQVTLENTTGRLALLNAYQPVTLEQREGAFTVHINQNEADAKNGKVVLADGEQIHFELQLNTFENGRLAMRSENSVFNRDVAVELV